jgi:hypothetical protein
MVEVKEGCRLFLLIFIFFATSDKTKIGGGGGSGIFVCVVCGLFRCLSCFLLLSYLRCCSCLLLLPSIKRKACQCPGLVGFHSHLFPALFFGKSDIYHRPRISGALPYVPRPVFLILSTSSGMASRGFFWSSRYLAICSSLKVSK